MSTKDKEFYIPSLDGLRCLAILLVFGSHLNMASGIPNFIPGSLGVTIFFFLSGLLITTLLRLEHEKTGTISFGRFYLRRTLRIFPPMYIVLAIAIGCGIYQNMHGAKDQMSGWHALGQIFHLTNYQIAWRGSFDVPIAPGTEVFWSLAVEEHFYLVFPLIFVGLARLKTRRSQASALFAVCALLLLWRCWLQFAMGAPNDRLYVSSDTRADSILYGCALALWGNPALDKTALKETIWKWILLPLGIAGILASLVIKASWFLETFRYTLQGICLIPIYVAAVRYPQWGPMKLLNIGWVKWIGVFSYTIYLFHQTAIHLGLVLVGQSVLALGLVSFTITVGFAAAMHFGVERPAARLRKKFSMIGRSATPAARTGKSDSKGMAPLSCIVPE